MYQCIFNHFYVVDPKSYRIRRNNANYTAIQGHLTSPILVPIESPLCDFPLVINTNLPLILHRFQVMADYWSNFAIDMGVPRFNAHAGEYPDKLYLSRN